MTLICSLPGRFLVDEAAAERPINRTVTQMGGWV